MNRRTFLQYLGVGTGTAAAVVVLTKVTPGALPPINHTLLNKYGKQGFTSWEYIFSSNRAVPSAPNTWFDAHRRHVSYIPTGREPLQQAAFDGRQFERVAIDDATHRVWYIAFNN